MAGVRRRPGSYRAYLRGRRRATEVSVAWLARQVRKGHIRWVLSDGSGGGRGSDGRTGSTTALEAVAATCKAVDAGGVTLCDCQGMADALAYAG